MRHQSELREGCDVSEPSWGAIHCCCQVVVHCSAIKEQGEPCRNSWQMVLKSPGELCQVEFDYQKS